MLSSRNIHFALLGIILGAASGYIFAFYQVESAQPAQGQAIQGPQGSANLPQGHPNVSNEQLATMFKDALQKNPNDTTLLTRYANFLFDLGRFSEAVEVFQKVVSLQPGNLDVKTDLGTAQWNAGDKDAAMNTYQQILKTDSKHMATLHNLVIAYLEDRNVSAAERTLKQMEQVDPKYEGLDSLRKRLAEVKGK